MVMLRMDGKFMKTRDCVTEKLYEMVKGTPLEGSWLVVEVLGGAIVDSLMSKNPNKDITFHTLDISQAGEIREEWERIVG